MIQQASISEINSRKECNTFRKNGYLPIITAPMNTVVDEHNYTNFTDVNIQVCLPRTIETIFWEDDIFISLSLKEFNDIFVTEPEMFLGKRYVCIDTANGNMLQLHKAIKAAKEIHGNNLIIMSGNVASEESFCSLSTTGVDYIRVGIGGSINACTTTKNTGVGQLDLEHLIKGCYLYKQENIQDNKLWKKKLKLTNFEKEYGDKAEEIREIHQLCYDNSLNSSNVKIVADGISTYIKQCEINYGFNDNGYAAINKLLYSGADLVMIGSLFAQALESSSEKSIKVNENHIPLSQKDAKKEYEIQKIYGKYYGMSTIKAQMLYKESNIFMSEGSISYLPIKYTLEEWVKGSKNQDNYPYLCGIVNSLKSAMSYTNTKEIENFKN